MLYQLALLVLLLIGFGSATTITWTGIAGDSQWTNHINWSPDQVPSIGDDVIIRCGAVQVTTAAGVNSLVLGGEVSCTGNMTVFNMFAVGAGAMHVVQNGLLIINSGLANVMGSVNITGGLQFFSGTAQGTWYVATIASPVDLGGEAEKSFRNCDFVFAAADVSVSGLINLNQSGHVRFEAGRVLASDQFIIQAPETGVGNLIDFSGAAFTFSGTSMQVMAPSNFGNLSLLAGNISFFDSVELQRPLHIPAGSVVQAYANASFSQVSGDGVFATVGSGVEVQQFVDMAYVDANAGLLNISGAGSSIKTLALGGAVVSFAGSDPLSIALLQMNGGSLDIGSASTVLVETMAGFAVTINGGNLNASVITQTASTSGNRLLSFSSTVTILNNFTLVGDLNILSNDNVYNPSLTIPLGARMLITPNTKSTQLVGGPINNDGLLSVSGAPVTWANMAIQGTGTFVCASDLAVSSGLLQQASMELVGNGFLQGSGGFQVALPIVTAPSFVYVVLGPSAFCLACSSPCRNLNSRRINAIVLAANASASQQCENN